jgi:hypothetical protein
MIDKPLHPPRVRQRVEAALKTKHHAAGMRRSADEYSAMDPTGTRFIRKDAAELDAKADADLSRWSYTTSLPEIGNGGELFPIPEPATYHIAEHVAPASEGAVMPRF